MALIKLRNLPASQPGDFTGQNLIAVALEDENLDKETKAFTCGEMISGMMQVFSGSGNYADFENGLKVSGQSVSTGDAGASIGGEKILNEAADGSILFGGMDPGDTKDITFAHGGDEKMKITAGGVNIQPGLTVNGLSVLTQGSNISTLANDAGYITVADIPSNLSHYNNDTNFLTAVDLPALISVGALTLKNGSEDLGTFVSSTSSVIDINVPKYSATEVAFLDSDIRLKSELSSITNPMVKVEKINGYNFIWNKDAGSEKSGEEDVGVIAQEIKEVIPEAVKDQDGTLKVAYHKIIPLLIECIKDQEKRIKHLEDKIKC
jgi:hypothetical protein